MDEVSIEKVKGNVERRLRERRRDLQDYETVKYDDNVSKSMNARLNGSLVDSESGIPERKSRRRLLRKDNSQDSEHDVPHTEPKFAEQKSLNEFRVEEIPPYETPVPVDQIRWKSSTRSIPRSLESVESAIGNLTIGNLGMMDREHARRDLKHQHPVFSQAPRSRRRRSSSMKLKAPPKESSEKRR